MDSALALVIVALITIRSNSRAYITHPFSHSSSTVRPLLKIEWTLVSIVPSHAQAAIFAVVGLAAIFLDSDTFDHTARTLEHACRISFAIPVEPHTLLAFVAVALITVELSRFAPALAHIGSHFGSCKLGIDIFG